MHPSGGMSSRISLVNILCEQLTLLIASNSTCAQQAESGCAFVTLLQFSLQVLPLIRTEN
jgi:ABC-type dipeptide/oligopeptide/nickel transport system ATPase component